MQRLIIRRVAEVVYSSIDSVEGLLARNRFERPQRIGPQLMCLQWIIEWRPQRELIRTACDVVNALMAAQCKKIRWDV